MLFEESKTLIPGCRILAPVVRRDARGAFVKTYHRDSFMELGITETFVEEFHSISSKSVVRGMHFQVPSAQHSKLVYCIYGEAFDVVLDLRTDSPAYKRFEVFHLTPASSAMVYVPAGCAHGFLALEDNTIVCYRVSSQYSPEADSGIRWDSFQCPWPVIAPVVSERDRQFPALADFESPFGLRQ